MLLSLLRRHVVTLDCEHQKHLSHFVVISVSKLSEKLLDLIVLIVGWLSCCEKARPVVGDWLTEGNLMVGVLVVGLLVLVHFVRLEYKIN
jgi:hypothetical protein